MTFLAVVLAVALTAAAIPRPSRRRCRGLVGLFLLALSVRLAVSYLFDRNGISVGDPFAGSSDAWAYDQWARRLVDAWSDHRWIALERWDQAGRWDVGFHYLLGGMYRLFGESVVLGRTVVAAAGALAVVFFFEVASRLLPARSSQLVALLYAFWPTSVAWNSYSVLRDSCVWALLLLAVWLAFAVSEGRLAAAPLLALALIALRLTRPYAFGAVAIGLALAGAVALVRRPPGFATRAAALALALAAAEAFFFFAGFPSLPRMLAGYASNRAILRNVDRSPAAPNQALVYPGTRPSARGGGVPSAPTLPHEEQDRFAPPKRLFAPSLPANAARFLISPPAWAPVAGDIRRSDNWQLPGMWIWYLVLPLSAIGFALGLARPGPARIVFAAALTFTFFLVIAGRGDFARQREMVVPIFLIAGAAGAAFAIRRPRLVAWAYVAYAVCFVAGIAYHRHTLRERGMGELRPPAAGVAVYEEVVCLSLCQL